MNSTQLSTIFLAAATLLFSGFSGAVVFPALQEVGDDYDFVIFADPQLSHADNRGYVAYNAMIKQKEAVQEVNARTPQPAFAIYLGDLCNVFDEKSVANFEDCIKAFKGQQIPVHGNHDGHPPYTDFRAMMQRVAGIDAVYFSFDVGQWHFVCLPCNLPGTSKAARQWEAEMLAWLEADLEANKNRSTIIFEHLHAMPQGLTQLEWYNFPLKLRLQLMDLFTRHGNVRYYINGHVHNGIKTSLKTAWTYKGINFLTAPTIIQPRQFGEAFPEFAGAMEPGGYYLVVSVRGDKITIRGRAAGIDAEFVFPDHFKPYAESIEPRWFKTLSEFDASPELGNGTFTRDFQDWYLTYRYQKDEEPGFVWKTGPAPHNGVGNAAYIYTRAMPPLGWSQDENMEIYQVVAAPEKGTPIVQARYLLEDESSGRAYNNGGGFIRVMGFSGDEFNFIMMFKWGENEYDAHFLPRGFGYALMGKQQHWEFLRHLGEKKQALFFNIPDSVGKWHDLTANIKTLYDQAQNQEGAYAALKIEKLYVGMGTWVNAPLDSFSGAWFDEIKVQGETSSALSTIDGKELAPDDRVFETEFGRCVTDRQAQTKKANR